jgi:hypothetical protein
MRRSDLRSASGLVDEAEAPALTLGSWGRLGPCLDGRPCLLGSLHILEQAEVCRINSSFSRAEIFRVQSLVEDVARAITPEPGRTPRVHAQVVGAPLLPQPHTAPRARAAYYTGLLDESQCCRQGTGGMSD